MPTRIRPEDSPPQGLDPDLLRARLRRLGLSKNRRHTETDTPRCCTDPVIRFKVNLIWKIGLMGILGLLALVGSAVWKKITGNG